jgi:hypothetical protein
MSQVYLIRFGKNMVSQGIKVTSSKTIIIAGQRARVDLVASSMVILPTVHPTKRPAPTGGVVNPIPRFTNETIPNVSALIPSAWTTGSRTGVTITIKGATSITIPKKISKTLMSKRIIIELSVRPKKK